MRRPDGSGSLDMDLAAPGSVGSEHTARQLTHTLRIVLTDQAAHAILRTRVETAVLTVDPVSREPIIMGQAYPNQFKVHVPSNPELLRILEANPQGQSAHSSEIRSAVGDDRPGTSARTGTDCVT